MQSCVALGHGQADHSALVRALEAMAQHPVAPDA
jgi:2-hydroxy-3-oxopropionate reductase